MRYTSLGYFYLSDTSILPCAVLIYLFISSSCLRFATPSLEYILRLWYFNVDSLIFIVAIISFDVARASRASYMAVSAGVSFSTPLTNISICSAVKCSLSKGLSNILSTSFSCGGWLLMISAYFWLDSFQSFPRSRRWLYCSFLWKEYDSGWL